MFLEGTGDVPLSVVTNNLVTTTEVGGFDNRGNKVVTGTLFTLDHLAMCDKCPLASRCEIKGSLPNRAIVRRVEMSSTEAKKQGANCQKP